MQNKKINHNYIDILKDSLKSKSVLLDELIIANDEQKLIADNEMFDYDSFDEVIEKKEVLINKLNAIDDGFVSVYNRVKDMLSEDRDRYAADIEELKKLIVEVTDKTVQLELSEKRNKEAVERKTQQLRDKVRASRTTSKVAAGYYHNMNKLNVIEPQFMDKKK